MKHGILKRVIALCMVGVMAFALVACGDSENKDEGEEVSQEIVQGSEDETMEVAKNEEAADTVNPSNNDVSVVHASSSGNSGNGFASPVFKPGEESNPGEEPRPGEGSQPGEESKPSAGTQSSTEPQQPKPSTEPQQPKPGAEPQQPQPSTGTQQPQQPQPGANPQQPSTGTQTVHTHNFQGGNCSTPAICSCGATGNYGSHNWVTKTIHHDATGHYEKKVTGKEQVLVGIIPAEYKYKCLCGATFDSSTDLWIHVATVDDGSGSLFVKDGHDNLGKVEVKEAEFIYEEQDKVENVWVEDTAAWDENITTCSICGTKQ